MSKQEKIDQANARLALRPLPVDGVGFHSIAARAEATGKQPIPLYRWDGKKYVLV